VPTRLQPTLFAVTFALPVKPYDAFISYNQAADGPLAAALAHALTRFARPWYKLRAKRVFLDKTSMSADPALRGAIERSLGKSQWLVVLACPASAASPWVNGEVAWWIAHRPLAKLIVVRSGGDIVWDKASGHDFDWARSSALPPALRGVYREEPLWVDALAARAAKKMSLAEPAFRDAFLNIAAPIHGIAKDELWSLERTEWRKRIGAAAVAVVLVLFFAWGAYVQNEVSRERSENIPSIQLGARALAVLPRDADLAAKIALAGVARRPSGVAAAALREAVAALAGPTAPQRSLAVANALDIAFSRDGERLAVLSRDGSVAIFGSASGQMSARLTPARPLVAHAIGWSEMSDTLAVAADDGVWLWSSASAAAPRHIAAASPVRRIAFAPNAPERLAMGHDDGSWRVVDVNGNATPKPALVAHDGGISAIAISTDGTRVATGGRHGDAALWQIGSGQLLARWAAPNSDAADPVVSVDFNRSGDSPLAKWMLLIAQHSGLVRVADAGFAADKAPMPAPRATPLPTISTPPLAAARFAHSGRCVAQVPARGGVDVHEGFGFGRLFQLSGESAGEAQAFASAHSSRYAVLRDGVVDLYWQPLCGDAEAVCQYAEPVLRTPMSEDDKRRQLPPSNPGERFQPPGEHCSRLIARLLGDWR